MTREDILHHFQDINFYYNDSRMYDDLSRMLDELISENKGEWIKDIYGRTICSYCGEPRRDNRIGHINFCNCCGCDMGGKRK